MQNGFNIDALLTGLAKRVAAEVCSEMQQAEAAPGVRPRLLTLEQAGQYLGRTRQAVEHMVRGGRLRAVKADRRIFLDREDLDEWIENNKTPGLTSMA